MNTYTVPLTVLIAVKNEEMNIRESVRSVAWADQVFVVDSHSKDRTREFAEAEGATVVDFDYDGGWPKKRNWGLETLPIRNEWVLLLDADERVTPELKEDIIWATGQDQFDGFYLKWQFIFLGRWMKYSWSHGWMVRLFRHGYASYEDLGMRGEGGWDAEVHENVVVKGRAGRLKGLLEHNTNQDISYWIRKQNEFSDWNAKRRIDQMEEGMPPIKNLFSGDPGKVRRWLKGFFIRLPFKPDIMFFYLYVIKGGFLDGKAGYYFCRLRAMHELNIQVKIYERQKGSLRS